MTDGRSAHDHRLRRARQLQLEELEHILGCNAASAYGRRYGFSDIRSVEDYQRRVPLTCHEDYEP